MQAYWLEQTLIDVPLQNDWLSENELRCLNGLRFLKRRTEWRLGRWTAKATFAAYTNMRSDPMALSMVEVRSAPSGAPQISIGGDIAHVSISLSHRTGRAFCVLAPSANVKVGCDLELVEPRIAAFLDDYLTSEERWLIETALPLEVDALATLLWSGKESALKALQTGLRLATTNVIVDPGQTSDASVWNELRVRCIDGEVFHGWWWRAGDFVHTIVCQPKPDYPVALTHVHGASYERNQERLLACAS